MRVKSLKESDLFIPVRDYLELQGYRVNAEVKNCDITASRDGELIVVELKTHFNATLLIQAAERQRVADSVYVALPHPADMARRKNWRGMCHLLKRLEMGLMLVHFLRSGTRIEIAFHPAPFTATRHAKKRSAIIREIHDRSGEYNTGGSTGTCLVTAYRERAIQLAYLLDLHGQLSPAALRKLGADNRTQSILSQNYYGWFERVKRGVYRLHPRGKEALAEYPEIVQYFAGEAGKN